MPARTLRMTMALITLDEELVYTIARMKVHPLTILFVAQFVALRVDLQQVQAMETALRTNIVEAKAAVDVANDQINEVIVRFHGALVALVGEDRKHLLHVHYFDGKTLPQVRRRPLKVKLDLMRPWIKSLATAPPSLQAFATEIKDRIATADDAVTAKAEAEQERNRFRDVGARKMLFDKVNGERKEVYGKLAKMRHEHQDLPVTFAQGFFLQGESRPKDVEEEPTAADLKERIATLEKDLTQARARLEVTEAEEAKAKAEAEEQRAEELALEKLETEYRVRRAKLGRTKK